MKTQINLTKYLELKSTFGFKKLDFLLNDISSSEAMIVKLISDDLDDYILYKQFENSEIIKREISTAGCYCYFRHKTILEKAKIMVLLAM